MIEVVDWVIVGLALVAFALFVFWILLNMVNRPVITWTIVAVGNSYTITIRSSSEITECRVAAGVGNCSIVHSSICVCQVAKDSVVLACSHDVCKLIVAR